VSYPTTQTILAIYSLETPVPTYQIVWCHNHKTTIWIAKSASGDWHYGVMVSSAVICEVTSKLLLVMRPAAITLILIFFCNILPIFDVWQNDLTYKNSQALITQTWSSAIHLQFRRFFFYPAQLHLNSTDWFFGYGMMVKKIQFTSFKVLPLILPRILYWQYSNNISKCTSAHFWVMLKKNSHQTLPQFKCQFKHPITNTKTDSVK